MREKLPSLTFSRRPKTRSGAKYGGWASGDYSRGPNGVERDVSAPLRTVWVRRDVGTFAEPGSIAD